MTAPGEDGVRFADILTTASSIATYLGVPQVTARHLADAVALVRGQITMEALGRPVSPLVSRASHGVEVDAAARELVQRWFFALHEDINARLDNDETALLLLELGALGETAAGSK